MTETAAAIRHDVIVAARDGLHRRGTVPPPLAAGTITGVAPAGPVLWVLAARRHLYRVEGDEAFLAASLAPTDSGTCVHVHAGEVWVGGDQAGLWRLDGTDLEPVGGFRVAPSSERWHTPWGGPPSVLSIASHEDDLYVSVHVGGIMRSSDGGRSWVPTIDLAVDVHEVAVDGAGGVWAATGARGLAHSTDRGATWRYLTDGLPATYLLAVAVTDDGVLVGVSSSHAARDGAVYRLEGDRFIRCAGLPADLHGAVSPRRLRADGQDAAVGLPGGDVYTSADGGRRWARLAGPFADIAEVALTAGP
jgi:photosystem II stability/assembly factor-like uncharacterized protein